MSKLREATKISLGQESRTIAQWSKHLGIPTSTIITRLQRGGTVKDALNARYTRVRRRKQKPQPGPETPQIQTQQQDPGVVIDACRAIYAVPMDNDDKLAAIGLLIESAAR